MVIGMRVAGVDGTGGGWIAIILEGGRFARAVVLRPIATDFAELGQLEAIGIDVPIGFGPRKADALTRGLLRGAGSTVFTVPARDRFTTPFGPGLGISAQAHALGPRILHVTERAPLDPRLFEVHPELSFRAMNGWEPLRHRKHAAGGAIERLALLHANAIHLDELGVAGSVPLDDVLDAAAAAWSAHRRASGRAVPVPDPPELVNGRPAAIWY